MVIVGRSSSLTESLSDEHDAIKRLLNTSVIKAILLIKFNFFSMIESGVLSLKSA